MDKQLANLFTILDQTQYEIDLPFQKVITEAILAAGFCVGAEQQAQKKLVQKKEVQPVIQVPGVKKAKKVSGYNLFVGDQMKQLKQQGVAQGDTLGKAVGLWKLLPQEEKVEWNNKAKGVNEEKVEKVDKVEKGEVKHRKPSGYNLFTKETMAVVKNNTDIPANQRMKEIGKMWKELSETDRDSWKEKAKQ